MHLLRRRLMIVVALVFVSMLKLADAVIVVLPKDFQAQIGTSAFFNCSSSVAGADIQWNHYPIGKTKQVVYAYGKVNLMYADRFTVHEKQNLLISSVTVNDAGTYECQDDYGLGVKHSAELIVLETNLICQSNSSLDKIVGKNICGIESNDVTLTCIAQYRGNKAATLEWKKNGDEKQITSGVSNEIRGNTVLHNLTMKGDSITDGSSYNCRAVNGTAICNSGTVTTIGQSTVNCEAESCQSYITAIICIVCTCLLICVGLAVFVVWKVRKEMKTKKEKEERKSLINMEKNKIKEMEKQIEKLQSVNEQLKAVQSENEQLKENMEDLGSHLFPRDNIYYNEHPSEKRIIETAVENKTKYINGIAFLENKLFVLHKNYPYIEVYDPANDHLLLDKFEIPGIKDPFDVASGKEDCCLFIIGLPPNAEVRTPESDIAKNQISNEKSLYRQQSKIKSKIIRLDASGKLLAPWPKSSGGQKGRISTYGSNVVVCLSGICVIKEYSRDAEEILTVDLSSTAGDGLKQPFHAVKVNCMHFAVSSSDKAEDHQRICVVDQNGIMVKECPISNKPDKTLSRHDKRLSRNVKFKFPIYLMADSEGSILVADKENSQVLLLSPTLKYERKLIELESGQFPVRICFDAETSLIFVATTKDEKGNRDYNKETQVPGPVRIFQVRKSLEQTNIT